MIIHANNNKERKMHKSVHQSESGRSLVKVKERCLVLSPLFVLEAVSGSRMRSEPRRPAGCHAAAETL